MPEERSAGGLSGHGPRGAGGRRRPRSNVRRHRPELVVWQAQLAAQESGVSSQEVKAALRRFDERIDQLNAMINSTPQLVSHAVRDASTRFDSSWARMVYDVHVEEGNLSATVSAERQAAVSALDAERAALAADAARIANQVIADTGEQVHRLVRDALILVIVLAMVVLGVPFAAGYFVGRATTGIAVESRTTGMTGGARTSRRRWRGPPP